MQTFLANVFGPDSQYYRNFTKQNDHKWPSFSPIKQSYGVLLAAKDDLQHGILEPMKTLVAAELFDDFLGQAEFLLDSGYHQPAAVLAGAVLEDGLRKLCAKKNILLPEKPKLDKMNTDLAKAGAYTALIQKRITALADIRNNTAHGKWDVFTPDDVKDMFISVRRIMEDIIS